MALTFKGGIHVTEHKNTRSCPVVAMPAPKTVSIPMSQHVGTDALPCVSVGDIVDKGQVIGRVENDLGCPVHASVSGKVVKIDEKERANGTKALSVVIENDGEDRTHESIKPWGKPLCDTTAEEIVEIVKAAGISGMGGAAFPTYEKIRSAIGRVDTVIINCAESEPFVTANHRLLLENPGAVVSGLKILMKALSLRHGIIAVEDNKPDAIKKLKTKLAGDKLIRVEVLKTKYPQGDERQLIYAITGKELGTDSIPADIGCCVFNVETCAAIYNAMAYGMPLVARIVTVDGDCIRYPQNVYVPLGTSYRDLIDFCGGLIREPKKIIDGGPIMGTARSDINASITKSTSALLALSHDFEARFEQPPTCIRCGRCVRGCPMRLLPSYIAEFSMKDKLDKAEKFNISSCIECGSCSYTCPGHVPLVQYIRAAKARIADKKQAAQDSTPKNEE